MKRFLLFLKTWSVPALVFVLPWQIVWIVSVPEVNGAVWDLGTVRVYGVSLLVWAVSCVWWREMWASVRGAVRRFPWVSGGVVFAGVILLAGSFLVASEPLLVVQQAWMLASVALCVMLLGMFVWASASLSDARLRSRRLLWTLLCSLSLQALWGVVQFAVQEVPASTLLGVASRLPETLGVSVIEVDGVRYLRALGGFPHPILFGWWMALGSFVALTLASFSARWRTTLLALGPLLLCVSALFVSFSRGAWIAFVVAVVVGIPVWMIRFRKKLSVFRARMAVTIGVLGVLCAALVMLFWPFLEVRTSTASRLEVRSVNERVELNQQGIELWQQQPWTGVGLGNSTAALRDAFPEFLGYELQPPHVFALVVLLEVGVIGVVLVGGVGILLAGWLWRARRDRFVVLVSFACLWGSAGLFDHGMWTLWPGLLWGGVVLGTAWVLSPQISPLD